MDFVEWDRGYRRAGANHAERERRDQRCALGKGRHLLTAPRPSAAHWRRVRRPRTNQSLVLEPLQRGVNGTHGTVASKPARHFAADGRAVRVVEGGERDENGELEITERG